MIKAVGGAMVFRSNVEQTFYTRFGAIEKALIERIPGWQSVLDVR